MIGAGGMGATHVWQQAQQLFTAHTTRLAHLQGFALVAHDEHNTQLQLAAEQEHDDRRAALSVFPSLAEVPLIHFQDDD
jgi:hypothetical protein